MKNLRVGIIVVLLIGIAGNAFAIELTDWKYRCEVTFGRYVAQYHRLPLTPNVYDVARTDLADVRLVDTDGQQVPYLLLKPKDITKAQKYNPTIINRSTTAAGEASVTLDFRRQVAKNSVEVETSGNNFRRAVKVEGSNDNVEFFKLVKQAYVFAIGNEKNSRFSGIDLPDNDYRYLRITIEPMAGEKKKPGITEIKAFERKKTLAERQPVQMLHLKHTEDEKTNSSIYEYDLGFRNLPISEIQLDITDESFYRYIILEGRDAATRKVKLDSEDNRERFKEVKVNWKRIFCGTIYRYVGSDGKKRENLVLSVPLSGRIYRYIKVTLRNYDDKPVEIESALAKMIPHQLGFIYKDYDEPALYVGCESASRPRYDLGYRLKNPLEATAGAGELGVVTENPLFGKTKDKPVAWTERHKGLLLMIMGAMILVLGAIIFKSFKSIENEQVQK